MPYFWPDEGGQQLYTLHTPTGRIDVKKEVFEAVGYALSELQGENNRLRKELDEARKGWSKQSDLNRELSRENIELRSAKMFIENEEAAKWKQRYDQLEKAARTNIDKVIVLGNKVRLLEEKLAEQDSLLCYCPKNEMEIDVLKAMRKARG